MEVTAQTVKVHPTMTRARKSHMLMKMKENTTVPTLKMERYEEADREATPAEKHITDTSLPLKAKKKQLKRKNIANVVKREGDIGVLRVQTAKARALSRLTKRVVGKSIGGETGVILHLRTAKKDIVDVTGRKAAQEADRQGNTAAVKRKGKVRVTRPRAILKADILLVNISHLGVVGNIHRRTRSIVENEDLPVRRHHRRRVMKRTVRRTENGDRAVHHSGITQNEALPEPIILVSVYFIGDEDLIPPHGETWNVKSKSKTSKSAMLLIRRTIAYTVPFKRSN